MPVYFLRNMTTGSVKIGWCRSQELNRRRSVLQTGNEHELLMIAAVPGDRMLEANLKARFAPFLIRGEWFRGEPDLLRQLAEIVADSFVRWAPGSAELSPPRPRKVAAGGWLVERFREKLEWASSDLLALAKDGGLSRGALFEAKGALGLPKPKKDTTSDGAVSWVWWVPPDWPFLSEQVASPPRRAPS